MVNRYLLIKDYNPAYRFWLRAELKKKRILGDREYSWKEAQDISIDMHSRGVHDDFFEKYFAAWTDAPEYSPDYFHLLRRILPIDKDGKPDLAVIAQLDNEAQKRGQRILCTIEDAAKDFYDFYNNFLTKPLARDLERHAEGRKLSNFFEYEEFIKLPDPTIHGAEKVEKASQEVASGLLQWLRGITPDRILDDIKRTLDQHYDKAVASASPEHSYNYKSEYVDISAYRSAGADGPAKTFLTPSRRRSAIRERYEEVFYPTYYVLAKP